MFILAFLAALASAETLYTSAPVTAARWPESDKPVAFPLEAGERVEVLARQGDKVRVSKGPEFGWVPAASLTEQAPTPDLPLDIDADAASAPPAEAPAAAPPAAEKPAGKSGKGTKGSKKSDAGQQP